MMVYWFRKQLIFERERTLRQAGKLLRTPLSKARKTALTELCVPFCYIP
jgi:hypothetical protein